MQEKLNEIAKEDWSYREIVKENNLKKRIQWESKKRAIESRGGDKNGECIWFRSQKNYETDMSDDFDSRAKKTALQNYKFPTKDDISFSTRGEISAV